MSGARRSRDVCVCVPARDEADYLPYLLDALADQVWAKPVPVVIALNNTADGSAALLERLAKKQGQALALHVDTQFYSPDEAHVGTARRRAMELGMARVANDEGAILLTTDADARPPEDWIWRNVAAIERGVDLVGGSLVLDDREPLSESTRARWEALAAYWHAVRSIEDEVDPVAWDPSPRHGDHTGGSLATTVEAYRRSGGVPPIPVSEDSAFVAAARAKGFKLAHPSDVWTRVSPRITARAVGGMATKLAALAGEEADAMAMPSLERWRERAVWRRGVRLVGGDAAVAAQEAALPPMPCDILVTSIAPEAAA